MEANNQNTEQIILEAATEVFLDKGFLGAKTTEIAQKADVNHALLHYYFRTKENLFNKVFENKAFDFLNVFKNTFDKNLSFLEKVKEIVEAHFNFIAKDPKIPIFIIREIITNKEKRDFILTQIIPGGASVLKELEKLISEEVEKGNIRPVQPIDLLLNIASLNVMTFVVAQVYYSFDDVENENLQRFLAQRRENNIELILKSLEV